ncbi:hypothetical protein GCM10009087_05010 [Sphingomonas oligophenolica]|uniref:DUF87 domain-containing protein n=1 Tax=Sphingomonas oligophenolica TaxID=301154 RepID=A0ABU9YCB1_9SPHN
MSEPSTYTPLSRRFTNERAREIAETERLYDWVRAYQEAFGETPSAVADRVIEFFEYFPEPVREALTKAAYKLVKQERHIWELPAPDFHRMSMREFVEFRNLLYAKQYFFANHDEILQLLHEGLVRSLYGVAADLPDLEAPSPFTIPLIYALNEPRRLVEATYGTLAADEYANRGLFRAVSAQLFRNICLASGIESENSRKPLKLPQEARLPLGDTVDTYLAGTPFHDVFMAPVPLKLTQEDRFSHMHIIGGTNAGKTTLIENLILHDLTSDDPPTIILIDPHSDLVRRLIHADLGIDDRLIIIDPRDTRHPPALNIFAINHDRMDKYDEATREQVTAGVIQTFNYLFGGLTNLTLTGKQDVFFRYVARLMLSLPETMGRNATILDMMKLMSDPAPYADAINALPEIPREFFLRDFVSKTFEQTKEQIRYRLQAIIENPTMARLFTSPETKVDLFTEMNHGAVILVDTAKDFLKENSSTFGRLFISLVLQAVLERAAIPEHARKPTFLIVDEAASFFSSNIDDLLTEARKYKCGCVFAHQYLDQATGSLKSSLHANTSIKFASGLSAADARAMAAEMRTSADFLLDQPRYQFAAHIRNVTPQAVSIPIQRPTPRHQRSSAAFEELIERNRARVSLPLRALQTPSAPAEPLLPDEDISPNW